MTPVLECGSLLPLWQGDRERVRGFKGPRVRARNPRSLEPLNPRVLVLAILVVLACARETRADEWPAYGRDPEGTRYSPLRQISRDNVGTLALAWTYHTGEAGVHTKGPVAFAATPILVDGTLYLSTPLNKVVALDPATGKQRWVFDPKVDPTLPYSELTSRGVSTWVDGHAQAEQACRRRLFMGTNDARLLAVDAATGKACADFGNSGEVDLKSGVGTPNPGEYGVTSPPAVIHDLVVVGSNVADNQRTAAARAVVRAYDARSGALRWSWEAPPPASRDRPVPANAWPPFAVDAERDLVFVPTGNTSPDSDGGLRNSGDDYSDSVVALRGSTGAVVWHYQTVHHDLWDYDVPAQPTLLTLKRNGADVAVVVQATKLGHIFVLERDTGRAVFPVEERAVPQSTIPGESSSPTQPFPTLPPRLGPKISSDDAWGLTPIDRAVCIRSLAALRNEGLFTPPSFQGSLVMPGRLGGSNWGGVSFDPERQILVTNYSNLPFAVRLIPRNRFAEEEAKAPSDEEIDPQVGTPYAIGRRSLLSPLGLPCIKPPWGKLAAINLSSGTIRWDVTFGTTRDVAYGIAMDWGTANLGGSALTGSGLIFIGAAMDNYLRAFDIETGVELWKGRLPAGGQATPMTYEVDGKQYVVIAAGGNGRLGTKRGDAVVAFALP